MKTDNPLLDDVALPAFSKISPAQIEPALDVVLAEARVVRDTVLAEPGGPTWENFIAPMLRVDNRLGRLWSIVSHLHHVANTDDLREAYAACLPKLITYSTEISQDGRLYARTQALADANAKNQALSPQQAMLLTHQLRDFKLAGVHLDDAPKAALAGCFQTLAGLSHAFDNNVLDASQGWTFHAQTAEQLAGIPDLIVQGAAAAAKARQLEGWVLTLDQPVYVAVMQHAQDCDVRQACYEAFVTRASDQGPNAGKWDNAQNAVDILAQRAEIAKILGYANYAEVSLVPKMVHTTAQVMDFVTGLESKLHAQATTEFARLQTFASEHLGIVTLAPWDVGFASEALRKAHFDLDQEQLRAYFPLPKVLEGLFALTKKLFDVDVVLQPGVDVWHPDVQCFAVKNTDGTLCGEFYLDACARQGKQPGAWVADFCERYRDTDGTLQTPVAFVNCNFNPADGDQPALLTHDDVLTLFHEFGHCLHHMLSEVDVLGLSGTAGVAWDCVEMPSQIMELWCFARPVIDMMSGHVETGEPLPDVLYDRMIAARHFHSGLRLLRQLFFARFDFTAHMAADGLDVEQLQQLADETRQRNVVTPSLPIDRFQNSFSHIFAGGYAAGYYSYLWAEILSSDAFSVFEAGDLMDAELGAKLRRDIFAMGGSKDFGDCFKAFAGRDPNQAAFLRHNGVGDCHGQ